jgi:hypothetical protein
LKSHVLDENAFGPGGLGNVFSSPDLWNKINSNPKLKMFAFQPDYVAMINDLQKNPGSMQKFVFIFKNQDISKINDSWQL